MITRRALLVSPVTLAAAEVGVPAAGRIAFRVTRNGSEIGTHTLTFTRTDTTLAVGIDVRLKVGLGPIALFRYRLTAVETWRDGRFAELASSADNDGEQLQVSARREAAGIVIESSKFGPHTVAAETLPLTHWNIADMSTPVFNPQDGHLMQLTVKPVGATRARLANGTAIPITRFAMTGEASIDDFYDENNVWAGSTSIAKDGSVIDYLRMT
jgi:hypothetical protein